MQRRSVVVIKVFELIKGASHATAAAPAAVATSGGAQQGVASCLRGWSALAGQGRSTLGSAAAGSTSLLSSAAARAAVGPAARQLQAAAWSQARQQLQQARSFTRQMYFPSRGSGGGGSWSSWGRNLDSNKVIWGLIAANAGVFLLWRSNPRKCWEHFTVSIESLRQGRLHTALTAAFSHQDFMHLAANMIGLYFFGRDVGRLFGSQRLLALYVVGGMAGSLAHCGWYYYQACKHNQGRFGRANFFRYAPPALGASAAVNAVMVTDILLYPTRTILLYGFIPLPAALLGVLWLMHDVTGTIEGKGHIAHAGHLGGAAVGLAFYALFRRGIIRPTGW